MRVSSAKIDNLSGLEYTHYSDRQGVTRKMFLRVCDCGNSQWIGTRPKSKECGKCQFKPLSEEKKKRISATLKKRYLDPVYKKRIMGAQTIKSGKDHWNWKGGVSSERSKIQTSLSYKYWRKEVYKRDNYQCRMCGTGKDLNAHHIIPYHIDPSKVLDIENGISLCKKHHTLVHKYSREVSHQNF